MSDMDFSVEEVAKQAEEEGDKRARAPHNPFAGATASATGWQAAERRPPAAGLRAAIDEADVARLHRDAPLEQMAHGAVYEGGTETGALISHGDGPDTDHVDRRQ